MPDPILKVKNEQELKVLLENERETEEYRRLMRIPQDGSRQASYARAMLHGVYGEGDFVYGADQGFEKGQLAD